MTNNVETLKLRQNIPGKIIQLDYDWITSLDGCCEYCLTDAQVEMILGVLDYFSWSTRWYSASGIVDKKVIENLAASLGATLMSNCCNDSPPVQYKWINNVLYRSTDGGVTFIEAPQYDYRNTSVQWPRPSEVGIESTKCEAADSVGAVFRDQINEQVTEDLTAAGIVAAIATVLLAFLSEGTSLFIGAQIQAVAAAILGAGVTAWQAAFTSEVWDIFRCLIYKHMDTDESINQVGLDAVYSELDTAFTGIVVPTLKGYIAAAGLVGINNMIAQLSGEDDADCSDCDECACDLGIWTIIDERMNPLVIDGCTITQEAALIAGNYYVGIMTTYPGCCTVQYNQTSGDIGTKLYAPCDYTGSLSLDESTGWVGAGLSNAIPVRGWLFRSPVPFELFFSF